MDAIESKKQYNSLVAVADERLLFENKLAILELKTLLIQQVNLSCQVQQLLQCRLFIMHGPALERLLPFIAIQPQQQQ